MPIPVGTKITVYLTDGSEPLFSIVNDSGSAEANDVMRSVQDFLRDTQPGVRQVFDGGFGDAIEFMRDR